MRRKWNWMMVAFAGLVLVTGLDHELAVADDHKKGKKDCDLTPEDAQMTGLAGWHEMPVFTVGETVNGYTPPGILDGIGAFRRGNNVRLLVNHELTSDVGYPYTLANGASLTGARVSFFDIDRDSLAVCDAGLAYDTIYNRAGDEVAGSGDLEFGGLNRLCSSVSFRRHEYGFRDDVYFTGEETGGGTEFVLDVKRGELWAAPAMGRAAWENVTAMETGDRNTVAILIGDDRAGAPLLLYIGEKQNGNNFLARNGLASGKLYAWKADNGDLSPEDFNGTGACRSGQFVELDYYRPDLAGNGDYDELGYATQAKQDALANAAGAFAFSRPEDVATCPFDGTLAVLASTGRDSLFPSDSWGTIYLVSVDFEDLSCEICVSYDGDDSGGGFFPHPDFGIRSPDNLDWADNGNIYINEDRSIGGFGLTSGEEASMWELDPFFPVNNGIQRIAQIDRLAGLPGGQTDGDPTDIGDWESSGVLDVSELFGVRRGTLLVADVQAHSVRDGSIGGSTDLVEGGQLFFLMKKRPSRHKNDDHRGRGRDRR